MNPVVSPADLLQIAAEVWTSFLDPYGVDPPIPTDHSGPVGVCGVVSVTGAWHGQIVVECSEVAARNIAAALFGMDPTEVRPADIGDSLSELANIIGGNVKSLLPGMSTLSLPYLVPVTGAHWPQDEEICRLGLTWLGEPILISVLQSIASSREAA